MGDGASVHLLEGNGNFMGLKCRTMQTTNTGVEPHLQEPDQTGLSISAPTFPTFCFMPGAV